MTMQLKLNRETSPFLFVAIPNRNPELSRFIILLIIIILIRLGQSATFVRFSK